MKTFKPFLTGRLDLAFHFASGLHHAQRRKGAEVPYIAHLMSVAALVLEAGGDEDQVLAALLHDAMEDQGGPPTLNTIRRLFGDRVAETIRECSDSESEDPEKKLPWHQRKQAYLAHLPTASPDALLVSIAQEHHRRDHQVRWGLPSSPQHEPAQPRPRSQPVPLLVPMALSSLCLYLPVNHLSRAFSRWVRKTRAANAGA
jgi:hypothetical protein